MTMDEPTLRVREAEKRFLKHWGWVFPAVGVALALLTGGGFWAWVDGNRPWLDWRQLWSWRALFLGIAGLAAIGLWRAFLRKKWPGWAIGLTAAAGFACVEGGVRIPAAQTAFWLAARSRGYMPEVCYIRLEEAAGRGAEAGAVVLAGSSQMIFGVDEQLLRKILAPRHVIRRECSGMWSQSMLAMWGCFPFLRGDVCVQIRSAFDFVEKPEFDADWYRPLASPAGLPAVLETVGVRLLAKNWRKVTDYTLAVILECWRMRDGMREIVRRFWGGEEKRAVQKGSGWGKRELEWSEWQWRAFEKSADMLREAGVAFWVFEGEVNPAMQSESLTRQQARFLRGMAEGAAAGRWRFIPRDEQNTSIAPGDWADMTHVNAGGREKLTRAMGRILKEASLAERIATCAENP